MSWEYEGLFDAIADGEADDLLADYWKSQPSAIRVGSMGYRTATIKAGPRLEAEVYPIFGRAEERRARAAKANITPEKQQRLNEERARRHMIRLVDANFTEKDIHLTLTYPADRMPEYSRARKDIRNFLLKLKRIRERRGLPELKYIYTIEENDDGRRRNIHVHMILNAGIDREELEAIWGKGYANADRLQPTERGLEEIASYIIKEARNRDGARKWSASRNLKQPLRRTSDAKTSNRVVKAIAQDIRNEAKEQTEKLYPRYRFVDCKVYYSDQLDGVYIRILMRRRRK